jgi:hypothetical protein
MQLAAIILSLYFHSECFVATCRMRKETLRPMASLTIFIHPTWMKIVGQIWNYFATNVVVNIYIYIYN